MGKQAREMRKMQEMAEMAADLEGIAYRKFMCAGFHADPVVIRTSLGQAGGVSLRFVMQDSTEREPITLDPIGIINLLCCLTQALAGRLGAVPTPNPSPDATATDADGTPTSTTPDAQPETVLPSGLIIKS